MKKNTILLLLLLFVQQVQAHYADSKGIPASWTVQQAGRAEVIQGYFSMLKDGKVYIESTDHRLRSYPLSAFSESAQAAILARQREIRRLNEMRDLTAAPSPAPSFASPWPWLLPVMLSSALLLLLFFLLRRYTGKGQMRYAYPVLLAGLAGLLISADRKYRSTTDPQEVDQAFIPFKPNVFTHWDANWFYVESKGIPTTHGMMVGISDHGWQQQLPIPQCYTGSNAWQVPLNPVPAATPVPVSPNHFTRGAIAIAANGVPIFNPFTNTGVDALVDGQLDNYGGHCGRADDYHYHIAPLHLYGHTADTLPIAYALDGYAVLGPKECDGSAMAALDANHGHSYGGTYHYHGTVAFPYMIGNMVGQVTEDTTFQIVPQAHANPVRPSGTPLNGALITGCTPNANNNGYTFTYTLGGQTYTIEYSWNATGVYTFTYITPVGTTTNTYNDFVQCNLPNAVQDLAALSGGISVYPNPTSDRISIQLSGQVTASDVRQIRLVSMQGQTVWAGQGYRENLSLQGLTEGNYIIRIVTDRGVFSKLLTKQ